MAQIYFHFPILKLASPLEHTKWTTGPDIVVPALLHYEEVVKGYQMFYGNLWSWCTLAFQDEWQDLKMRLVVTQNKKWYLLKDKTKLSRVLLRFWTHIISHLFSLARTRKFILPATKIYQVILHFKPYYWLKFTHPNLLN